MMRILVNPQDKDELAKRCNTKMGKEWSNGREATRKRQMASEDTALQQAEHEYEDLTNAASAKDRDRQSLLDNRSVDKVNVFTFMGPSVCMPLLVLRAYSTNVSCIPPDLWGGDQGHQLLAGRVLSCLPNFVPHHRRRLLSGVNRSPSPCLREVHASLDRIENHTAERGV